jgi:hypothetical protein
VEEGGVFAVGAGVEGAGAVPPCGGRRLDAHRSLAPSPSPADPAPIFGGGARRRWRAERDEARRETGEGRRREIKERALAHAATGLVVEG